MKSNGDLGDWIVSIVSSMRESDMDGSDMVGYGRIWSEMVAQWSEMMWTCFSSCPIFRSPFPAVEPAECHEHFGLRTFEASPQQFQLGQLSYLSLSLSDRLLLTYQSFISRFISSQSYATYRGIVVIGWSVHTKCSSHKNSRGVCGQNCWDSSTAGKDMPRHCSKNPCTSCCFLAD